MFNLSHTERSANRSLTTEFKQVLQILMLCTLALNVGCSDSSDAKRNARNTFNLDLRSSRCGVHIKKTFTTQTDICQYISYEASTNACLYYDLQREFNRYACNTSHSGNPIGYVPPTTIDYGPIGGPIPSNPVVHPPAPNNSTYWNDLNDTYQSILNYYSVDASGCIATIKNTFDTVDLCVGQSHTLPDEKDQDFLSQPYVEPTPEKDEAVTGNFFPPPPAGAGQAVAPDAGSVAETAQPAPETTGRLDYNLVYFNARSLIYEELSAERLPVLIITGNTDPNSPIYNLRHSGPDFKTISFSNVSTSCPMQSKLSTSGNTIILSLFTETGSTAEEITTCRTFFDSIATVESLEFSFAQPLVMSNGTSQNVPFRFVNQ